MVFYYTEKNRIFNVYLYYQFILCFLAKLDLKLSGKISCNV